MNTISKSQLDSLTNLYSDYDYFSGEALFSNLLTTDDNYNLAWQSFGIIVKESRKDTCYISALTTLDTHINTNAELAEEMSFWIVQAIQNNPLGFLEMYGTRNPDLRQDFANYISVYDEPDSTLIVTYTTIYENSADGYYQRLAQELVQRLINEEAPSAIINRVKRDITVAIVQLPTPATQYHHHHSIPKKD